MKKAGLCVVSFFELGYAGRRVDFYSTPGEKRNDHRVQAFWIRYFFQHRKTHHNSRRQVGPTDLKNNAEMLCVLCGSCLTAEDTKVRKETQHGRA